MTWTSFAIAPRMRLIATALMYGLTLTVRLTSTTGEESSAYVKAAQCAASTFHNKQPETPAYPTADLRRPSSSQSCRADCRPTQPT